MADNGKTFVLVHGAWHGGWCWRRVGDLLTRKGFRVFAPTLTGLGERAHLLSAAVNLTTHIEDVANLIRFERLDSICLVGHSYAGFPISGVAELLGARIASIVFLDAFAPEDGDAPIDVVNPAMRGHVREAIERGEIARAPPPAAYFKLMQAADEAWVDALMTPQPIGVWTEPLRLTGARERIARKTYIRAGLYPSEPFDRFHAACAQKPGWRCFTIAAGHDVMVDAPERLAEILAEVG